MYSNKVPNLKCGANLLNGIFEATQSIEDKFSANISKNNKIGNGLLTYPLALITADEVSFAGGKVATTLTAPYAWYYKNKKNTGNVDIDSITGSSDWWTLSPSYFSGSVSFALSVRGSGSSELGSLFYGNYWGGSTNKLLALRPVISLTSNVLWASGDGTYNNPYRIQ